MKQKINKKERKRKRERDAVEKKKKRGGEKEEERNSVVKREIKKIRLHHLYFNGSRRRGKEGKRKKRKKLRVVAEAFRKLLNYYVRRKFTRTFKELKEREKEGRKEWRRGGWAERELRRGKRRMEERVKG